MNITVIGTGYVGIVTAVVLADFGNHIYGLDIDPKRIEDLKAGKTPIYEPGLEDLLKRGVASNRLHFTTSYRDALENSSIIFVCVGTPQKDNGEVELKYVESAIKEIAQNLKTPSIIILKSTVPPGIHYQLKKILDDNTQIHYEFASVPEFLREGSAIDDTLNPSRIVIGVESEKAKNILLDVHKSLPGERVITDIVSAQMIKYTANAFLATKISFANAIARISDLLGADVSAVMKGIGLDPRIGMSFLYPGFGFGGSCFPKDIKGLYHLSSQAGYDFKLLKEVDQVNEDMVPYVYQKVKQIIPDMENKKVGILGLAFKPETDDMREARSIPLINLLLQDKANVVAYDPIARETAQKVFQNTIEYVNGPYQVAQDADVVFLVTEWNEFKELDLYKIKKMMRGNLFVDGRNLYNPQDLKNFGFSYIAVGRR
jgi:UDPglucose 6-dehydrogenase